MCTKLVLAMLLTVCVFTDSPYAALGDPIPAGPDPAAYHHYLYNLSRHPRVLEILAPCVLTPQHPDNPWAWHQDRIGAAFYRPKDFESCFRADLIQLMKRQKRNRPKTEERKLYYAKQQAAARLGHSLWELFRIVAIYNREALLSPEHKQRLRRQAEGRALRQRLATGPWKTAGPPPIVFPPGQRPRRTLAIDRSSYARFLWDVAHGFHATKAFEGLLKGPDVTNPNPWAWHQDLAPVAYWSEKKFDRALASDLARIGATRDEREAWANAAGLSLWELYRAIVVYNRGQLLSTADKDLLLAQLPQSDDNVPVRRRLKLHLRDWQGYRIPDPIRNRP